MGKHYNKGKISLKQGLQYLVSGFCVGLVSMGIGYAVTKKVTQNYIINYANPAEDQVIYRENLDDPKMIPLTLIPDHSIIYTDKVVTIASSNTDPFKTQGYAQHSKKVVGDKITTDEDVYIVPPIEFGRSHRSKAKVMIQSDDSENGSDNDSDVDNTPDNDNGSDADSDNDNDNSQIIEDLRKLLASINEVIQTKKQTIADEKTLIEQTTNIINESKDGVNTDKASLETTKINLQNHIKYLSDAKINLVALQDMRKSIVYDITGVKNSLAGERITLDEYGNLLTSIKEKIQENNEVIAHVRNNTAEAKDDLQTIIASLKANISNKQQAIVDISNTKTKITEDRGLISSLNDNIQENKQLISELQLSINEFQTARTNYNTQKDDLSAEKDKLTAVNTEISHINTNIENNNVLKESYQEKIKEALKNHDHVGFVKYTKMLTGIHHETIKLSHSLQYKEKLAGTINENVNQKTTDLNDYKTNTYDPLKVSFDRDKPLLVTAKEDRVELKSNLGNAKQTLAEHVMDLDNNQQDKLTAVNNIKDLRVEKPIKKMELEALRKDRQEVITIKNNLLLVKTDYINTIASTKDNIQESKEKLTSAKTKLADTKNNILMYKNDKAGYKEKITDFRAEKKLSRGSIILFKKAIADQRAQRQAHRDNLNEDKQELAIHKTTKGTIKEQLNELTGNTNLHTTQTTLLFRANKSNNNKKYINKTQKKTSTISLRKKNSLKKYQKKSLKKKSLRKKAKHMNYSVSRVEDNAETTQGNHLLTVDKIPGVNTQLSENHATGFHSITTRSRKKSIFHKKHAQKHRHSVGTR